MLKIDVFVDQLIISALVKVILLSDIWRVYEDGKADVVADSDEDHNGMMTTMPAHNLSEATMFSYKNILRHSEH